MRTLRAVCWSHSVVFLLTFALVIQLLTLAAAVMPPSTSLQTTEDQKTSTTENLNVNSDLGLQILAQVRANHQLLEKIEQEENAIAVRLQSYSIHSTLEVSRS